MMVTEDVLSSPERPYDVVIVGAGAAGLSMAGTLALSGHHVLLIEGGRKSATKRGQQDYAGMVAPGCTHPGPHLYRIRALGGTTTVWGGRCIPLDPIDFEARSWVANSGWPIGPETLQPYYEKALDVADAGELNFDPASIAESEHPSLVPALDGQLVRTTLERFSLPTNFWKKFERPLVASPTIHILPEARVTQIEVDTNDKAVRCLTVVARSGRRHSVSALAYVLAGGTIETTRLLLASAGPRSEGAFGKGRALGRYYTTHICTTAGTLTGVPARGPISYGYARDGSGVFLRRRLSLTDEAQRKRRLLNTIFRTHLPDPGDPSHRNAILSCMFLTKSFLPREYALKMNEHPVPLAHYVKHAANLARQPLALTRFAAMWTNQRILASRKLPSVVLPSASERYVVEFQSEQIPDISNRLSLGSDLDLSGQRQICVDWRLTGADEESLVGAYDALATALETSGAGTLDYDPDLLLDRARQRGAAGGHHMGTTRMSADERLGVVDRDCKVHGMANLYIASAAVFPTSGQANPTLTIVALALRLADRLVETLARARAAPVVVSPSERYV